MNNSISKSPCWHQVRSWWAECWWNQKKCTSTSRSISQPTGWPYRRVHLSHWTHKPTCWDQTTWSPGHISKVFSTLSSMELWWRWRESFVLDACMRWWGRKDFRFFCCTRKRTCGIRTTGIRGWTKCGYATNTLYIILFTLLLVFGKGCLYLYLRQMYINWYTIVVVSFLSEAKICSHFRPIIWYR